MYGGDETVHTTLVAGAAVSRVSRSVSHDRCGCRVCTVVAMAQGTSDCTSCVVGVSAVNGDKCRCIGSAVVAGCAGVCIGGDVCVCKLSGAENCTSIHVLDGVSDQLHCVLVVVGIGARLFEEEHVVGCCAHQVAGLLVCSAGKCLPVFAAGSDRDVRIGCFGNGKALGNQCSPKVGQGGSVIGLQGIQGGCVHAAVAGVALGLGGNGGNRACAIFCYDFEGVAFACC